MKYQFVGILILLTFVLSGCGGQQFAFTPASTPTTPPTAIVQADTPTDTPVPPATDTPVPLPTDTPIPADTATPTSIPTDTPVPPPTDTPTPIPPTATPTPSVPSVTVDVDLNVRAGPGTNYDRVGVLASGTTVEVIGRTEDAGWWQIIYPNADGVAWISSAYGIAQNTDGVLVAIAPPTPIPVAPTSTPVPAAPPAPEVDFRIVEQRLWTNEENGGWSPNGSVSNCGYGHEIYVRVIDAAGQDLNGIIIKDIYNNPPQITGSKGPGRAQYILYFNGYNLFVAEDGSAGRPVTSETSATLSAKEIEIPIPQLMAANYCATEAECQERVSKNALCQGHYSWSITFQRAW